MPEITKSISEVLRSIKSSITADVELFDFPDLDVGCALSVSKIESAKKTGNYFTVGVSILIECRVSNAINGRDSIVMELSADVFSQVENNTFNCTGKNPENIIAVPYGIDGDFTAWVVSWDQEFYVEYLNVI